jgi:5-methylcytosine-specific restriction endonuclease McrA
MPIEKRRESNGESMQLSRYKPRERATVARNIRSGKWWQQCRQAQLLEHPFCADPFGWHRDQNRIELAKHVHHVIPLEERPDLALDQDNLRSLCVRCHGAIEGRERTGRSTRDLFKAANEGAQVEKSQEGQRNDSGLG